MAENVTWLTQEAHDRLQAELAHLTNVARIEIAKRIEAAREEGDLKENGGYHAAKDEQGKIEARIRQLTDLLRHVEIGTPPDDGVVEAGMLVTARIQGDETTFVLGSREIAGDADIDVYSEQSPLGRAIIGLKAGESASYLAPSGKSIAVEVITAKPYAR